MSADPLASFLGGAIQQHQLNEPPALVHHSERDADFWIDSWAERDLESLLGDVEQTLASAHGGTGLTQVRNDYGFIGTGQTVAIIDSGIAWDHSALGGGFGANYRVVGGWDFSDENDAIPYDDGPSGSHGTHVAGIVGSDRAGTNDDGVASGVDLVGLRVFDDAGAGYFHWVENALRWVHQNRNAFENPITAVNLSLGTSWNANTVPNWSTIEDEFAQLKADGIFVAVSAGNSFTSYNAPGLSYPAASPHVVPVMSVDDGGNLSSFSQRHSRAIAAPGRYIVSTIPDYVGDHNGVNDDFASYSGTSMASPYVAGASVLVREAMQFVGYANITQDTIYNHMMATATTFLDAVTHQSYKRLNLANALNALMPSDDYGSTVATAYNLDTLNGERSIEGLIGKLNDKDFFTFTAGAAGTLNLTVTGTHGLEPNVSVAGIGATLQDGTLSFDIVAGQSYTFSLQTAAGHGIGHYDAELSIEESFTEPVMTVKTVVRFDGLVFSLDTEGWIRIDGYRLWSNTADFALGADGTVFWQSVNGVLAHRLTSGTWYVLNRDTTKFAVQSDGTVLSLDSAGWISVDGYRTWCNTEDFTLTATGEIYWQGTNRSFARRGNDRLWQTIDMDITRFAVRNDGMVFALDTENCVSVDGYRTWGITQDFWLAADGTIYWQGTNSSLARRAPGGSWETLSLDTIKFAVRHDGVVFTLSRNGNVYMDGVRKWTNVTDICLDNLGRLVVECANKCVHCVSGRYFTSREATVASNAVGVQGGQSSGGDVSTNAAAFAALTLQTLPSVIDVHLRATPSDQGSHSLARSELSTGANFFRSTEDNDGDIGRRWDYVQLDDAAEHDFTGFDFGSLVGHALRDEDALTRWNAFDSVYGRIGDLI